MKLVLLSPFSSFFLEEFGLIEKKNANLLPRGSGGIAVKGLVQEIINSNIDLYIITYDNNIKNKYIYNINKKINYIILPERRKYPAKDFWARERTIGLKMLKKIDPDVIHAHWTYKYGLLALNYDRNISLVTVHDIPHKVLYYTRNLLYLPYLLTSVYVLKNAKWISFVSEEVKNKLTFMLNKNANLFVNYNSVEEIKVKQYDIKLPNKYVISVARFDKLKNIKNSIKAFSLLKKNYPDLYYIIIGNGFEKNGAGERWIRKNGYLDKNIILYGRMEREKVQYFVKNSLFLLHPSYSESFGLAVAEAMKLGKPVIVGKNSDGATEIVMKADGGLLVDVNSINDIILKMKMFLQNEKLRQEKAKNAKLFSKIFNSKHVFLNYYNIYTEIIRRRI